MTDFSFSKMEINSSISNMNMLFEEKFNQTISSNGALTNTISSDSLFFCNTALSSIMLPSNMSLNNKITNKTGVVICSIDTEENKLKNDTNTSVEKTLYWDIIGSFTPTSSSTYSVDFNTNIITSISNNIFKNKISAIWDEVMTSNKKNIINSSATIENNLIDPNSFKYTVVEPAKSTVDITEINLKNLKTATLKFDYMASNPSINTIRALYIIDSLGTILKVFNSFDVKEIAQNVSIDLSEFIGMSDLTFRFITSTDVINLKNISNFGVWNIFNLSISITKQPITKYISSRATYAYYINPTNKNNHFSFDYVTSGDDLVDMKRMVIMHTSLDGTYWKEEIKALVDPSLDSNIKTFPFIPVPEGKYVKFEFIINIQLPRNLVLPTIRNLFTVSNLKVFKYT